MSKTSSEVKRRYNAKTYSRWSADLRKEEFDRIETLRGELSRAAFLRLLVERYAQEQEPAQEPEGGE